MPVQPHGDPSPRVPQAETWMRKKGVNIFQCPVCRKYERQDDEFEPMCTGPDWTDDHEMVVMRHVRVDYERRLHVV